MARYPLGAPVTVPFTVRDRTGALVDPDTFTLVVKLAQDDGTWATTGTYTSPAKDSQGTYHQDIPAADLNAIGHYQYALTTTGQGAGVIPGDFDVYDPFEQAVLPLQDAKLQLNIPATDTTYDSEIQDWIATIQTSLEGMTGGPLTNRTVTDERCELDGTYTVLQVRQRPLVSVTSIVAQATGQALDISAFGGLDIDPNACTVRRKLGYPFYGPYFAWMPVMLVTYVAGWGVSVPAAFNGFARIVIQHLWETQHGPSARPSMAGDEMVSLPGFGFAIPDRAAELLNGTLNGMPLLQEAYV